MNVGIGRQNNIICFKNNEAAQFHFWQYINRNQTFILDSHRPFIYSAWIVIPWNTCTYMYKALLECLCTQVEVHWPSASARDNAWGIKIRTALPDMIRVHVLVRKPYLPRYCRQRERESTSYCSWFSNQHPVYKWGTLRSNVDPSSIERRGKPLFSHIFSKAAVQL